MKIFKDGDNPLYQPWSERDFRADFDAAMLDWLQRYMYRTLCQAAFVCYTRPYLPDDDAKLWALAGCQDRDQWEENKGPVRAMFTPIKRGGQNLLARKRIVDDWQRLVAKRRAQRRGGQIGGRKASHPKLSEVQADETQANLELTSSPPQAVKRSKGKEREVKVSQDQPTHQPVDGRTEGLIDSTSKPSACGGGQVKKEPLSGWRLRFQKQIQETAADKNESVVFKLPLPDSVFEFVESYGDDSEPALFAVLDWLRSRSFTGLSNPNVVWASMPDEIHGFLSAYGLTADAIHAR